MAIQDQTLSLTPPAPEPETLDLDTGVPSSLPPSPDVAARRSYKAAQGLGEFLGKPLPAIFDDISSGKEGDFRNEAAGKLDIQNQLIRQQKIKDATLQNGRPLTMEEVNAILDPNAPHNRPVDPSSVIEESYGHSVINTLDEAHTNLGTSILGTAQRQVPLSLGAARQQGSAFSASRERALTEAENLQDQIGKQSWLGWGWDTAKTFFQPYDEIKLRGLVDGNYFQGGGLSSNLSANADALMSKTFPEQNAFWNGPVWQKLKSDNPQLASQFLTAFLGQSSSDRILGDLNTAMVIPDIQMTKALGKALANRVGLINQSRNAVRSVVEASQLPNASKASMLEAAGDVEGAATHQATSNLTKDLQGHPDLNQRALDALPTAMRSDQAAIREKSPGREIVNRLEEDTEGLVAKLQENVLEGSGVMRNPEAMAEDAVRKMIVKQRDNYRGPGNSLGDSTGPFLDERSKNYFIEHQLRNADATFFETPEQARGWGKANGFPTETPRAYYDSVVEKINTLHEGLKPSSGMPPIPEGHTRLYRGEGGSAHGIAGQAANEQSGMTGGWFTTDRNKAKLYGDVKYIDVENRELGMNFAQGHGGKDEFVTDQARFRDNAKPVKRSWEPSGPNMDADVHELNRHVEMQNQLESLIREKNSMDASGLDGYRVKQNGLGFYISYMQPYNETDRLARSFIATTHEGKLQDTVLNGVSRWLRTPAETLSKLENEQRVVATHGPAVLQKLFFEASEPIKKLPGKYYEDWSKAIDYARVAIDPATGKPGYFFRDISEMEDWYQRYAKNGRLPEDPEIRAYFAYKRNIEAERQLRITRSFSLKTRIGTEQHSFYSLDKNGERVPSDYFEGVRRNADEPFGGEDTVLLVGKKVGEEKLMKANDPRLKKVKENIKKGQGSSVEVFNPDAHPLKNYGKVGDARVRFVVTDNLNTKPLSYDNQINRAGGGHFVYDYDNYIKTPDMRFDETSKHWNYAGDVTAFPVGNPKIGKEMVPHLNEVSRLIKEGKMDEAQAYHTANELPMKWEDHKAAYEPTKLPDGTIGRPRFPKGAEFYVVPKNSRIVDMDKALEDKFNSLLPDSFRDRTRQGSLARTSTVEFSSERDAWDLHAIDAKGNADNPIFNLDPARKVDPIETYNRALARIINSSYMDDYKIHAVERWIAQARDLLTVDAADLNHAPMYYFRNANNFWKKDADKIMKASLQSAKFSIDQFVGTPSKVEAYINAVSQRIAESIYGKLGPDAAGKFTQVADLAVVKDPIAFMRGATFHLKMGLGSIPQVLMQMTTAANVVAIAGPKHTPASLTAVMLHQWSRLNSSPEILAHMDDLASKMSLPGFSRFKPGEWLEARDFITKYLGFDTIGGEHAFRDTPWSAKIVKNLGKDILDWGEAPFREGAQFTRLTAAYTAYLEFRQGPMSGKGIVGALTGGPDTIFRRGSVTGALSREDKAAIAVRAADLDHNMSRAANSVLHTGVMSPFGQFTAYSLRLMELTTGKRLTWQEKGRLFGVSSMLYGVPLGGLGLYGYPIGDYIRQKALDNGYIVGDNFINTTLMEGLPSEIMKIITGNNYNISRFGVKGFEPAGELMDTDYTLGKILGGAAFSTFGNMWAETSGLRNFAMSTIRGDQEQFPLTQDDLLGVFKEATFVNSLVRAKYALNYGKWLSKNGVELSDVSPGSAIFQTLTGLVNQKTADITVSAKALKSEKDTNIQTEKAFEGYVKSAMMAQRNNDPDQAEAYLMKAKAIIVLGDYPQQERPKLWAKALANRTTLDKQLVWDYLMRNPPASRAVQRQHTYERINEIDQQEKAQ